MQNLSTQTDIPELLKRVGLRVTPQREAILNYLIHYNGHTTVDDIYQAIRARFPGLSISTVYNTMKQLGDLGLVKEITFGDAASRFDINAEPHHHLVCKECGQLIDFYLPELPEFTLPPEATGFDVEDFHIEIKGTCANCRSLNEQGN